jgi:hypothetical protein
LLDRLLYSLGFFLLHCFLLCASFYGGVFDFAHRLQQRSLAPLRRNVAVGLEQFPEVSYQVGIGKQARPVGALGEQFRVFAHTQKLAQPVLFTAGKYSIRILRLDFRARLNKMTEVTLAAAAVVSRNWIGYR